MVKTVGIDGCKGGWVAFVLEEGSHLIEVTASVEELLIRHKDAACLLIDMPIGLPETIEESEQRPERETRKLLGRRSSTVFNVPCRQAVAELEYAEANAVNREVLGKGLSKQSFYIASKISELDMFLRKYPELGGLLKESHPELIFAILSEGGRPLEHNKKTEAGYQSRLEVIARHDSRWETVSLEIAKCRKLQKIRDDIIDAYALAVAGVVGMHAGFRTIPERPVPDRYGIMMQMLIPLVPNS